MSECQWCGEETAEKLRFHPIEKMDVCGVCLHYRHCDECDTAYDDREGFLDLEDRPFCSEECGAEFVRREEETKREIERERYWAAREDYEDDYRKGIESRWGD